MKFAIYIQDQIGEIERLVTQVFTDSEGVSEGGIVGKLTHDLMQDTPAQDLYGFVALDKQQIIGSIFFSRLTFENKMNAFILSPVAVHTDHQGQGVGQQLINFGIQHLKDDGVTLIFTYGDPEFYKKVGFAPISEEVAKAPLPLSYPHGWLCQTLDGSELQPIAGASHCVSALNHAEYW